MTTRTNETSEKFYALEYRPKDNVCFIAVFLTPEARELWLSDSVKPGFIREAITADTLEKLHQNSALAPVNKKLSEILSVRYAPTGEEVH
jgi:hypothetical protein